MCNYGAGIEVMERNGGKMNVYDYSRELFENDAFTRYAWRNAFPEADFDNFDDFNNYVAQKAPGFEAGRDSWFGATCMNDDRLQQMDMFQTCNESSDCRDPTGMFNQGCCVTLEVTGGNLDALDEDTRKSFNLVKETGMGVCTNMSSRRYMERVGESNFFEYQRNEFDENEMVRDIWAGMTGGYMDFD